MKTRTDGPRTAECRRRTLSIGVPKAAGLVAVLGLFAAACSDQTTAPTLDQAQERDATVAARGASAAVPPGQPHRPTYVTAPRDGAAFQLRPQAGHAVIRVYQDERPWFDANRAHTTLVEALGKSLGVDYFIHPLIDLQAGIPAGTRAVVITSNSQGEAAQAERQNHPAAQAALEAFLATGGSLVVDMGDNFEDGGFIAPGSIGTPDDVFSPDPCHEARLTPQAAGHPMVLGPNGLAGTDDDLTNDNVSLEESCSVAHGNLEQGIVLPVDHTPLMTARFVGVDRVIMAEYCHLGGRVILDTNTKEFFGQTPAGFGPSRLMTSLFHYALSEASSCPSVLQVDIDIRPGGGPNVLNPRAQGVIPVAILSRADFDASGEVDRLSLTFGRTGDEDSLHRPGRPGQPNCTTQDVNGDRRPELVCRFEIQMAGFRPGDTEGILRGRTRDGLNFEGRDAVRLVPGR